MVKVGGVTKAMRARDFAIGSLIGGFLAGIHEKSVVLGLFVVFSTFFLSILIDFVRFGESK
jgi:hypothetical protein